MRTISIARRLPLSMRTTATIVGLAFAFSCLSVSSAAATPPTNDNFAGAIVLAPGGGTKTADNIDATKEAGEPNHAGDEGGASLWYAWTPSFSGTASIDTNGSIDDTTGDPLDTLLAAYTGTSVSGLTTVASSDDDDEGASISRVCFTVTASTTYMIAVDGYAGDTGAISLTYGPKGDAAPCPTLPPTVTGPAQPKVGDTLSLLGGSFVDGTLTRSLTWARCSELLCIPIDGATGTSYVVQQRDVGTAIRVRERATTAFGTAQNESAPTAAASMTGTTHANGRIYWVTKLPSSPSSFRIVSMFADGTGFTAVTAAAPSLSSKTEPAVSPDGKLIAFVDFGNGGDVEVMNADGTGIEDLGLSGTYPTWSPDGSRVAFVSSDGIESVDELGNDVLLLALPAGSTAGPISWSPDGSKIAFSYRFPGHSDLDIALVSADGRGPITQLTTSTIDDHDPSWSPTGDRIAFERGPQSGSITDGDLYVVDANGANQSLLYDGDASHVAHDGTAWSPEGTTILFSVDDNLGSSQLFTIPAAGGSPTALANDGYQNNLAGWGVAVPPSSSGGGGGAGGGSSGPPNLNVSISGPSAVTIGAGFQLVVTIGNKGGGTSSSTLTLDLNGLTYVSSQVERGPGCSASGSTVSCPLDFFPAGLTTTVRVNVQPTSTTVSARASVTSSPADSSSSDDVATWTAQSAATAPAASAPATGPVTTPASTPSLTPHTIVGTSRADHLMGTRNDDVLKGLGGNDVLSGGKGNDTIYGGSGNDKLIGGPGKDQLFAGAGNDTVFSADGAKDSVDCGTGNDTVVADKLDNVAKSCDHVRRVPTASGAGV